MDKVSKSTTALETDNDGIRGGWLQSETYRGPWTMNKSAGSNSHTE